MTSNFDICDSLAQPTFFGARSIGSCGSIPSIIFVANQDSRALSQRPCRSLNSFFPKGLAGPFTQANHVKGVNLSMSATNAERVTRLASVVPIPHTTHTLASRSVPNLPLLDPREHLNSPPVTPVNLGQLQIYLAGYDQGLSDFLLAGFRFGFSIPFFGERSSYESPNLKSALDNPYVVRAKLGKELDAGRIVGPFTHPPFQNFRSSPLGVVPKKTPSEFRLIHHLSYPSGASVNDFIPKELSTVRYATIDDAISIIKKLGPGCYLAKTDIQAAFRIIPIHPKDHPLLGMCWEGRYYFDRTLPMGLSFSCCLFEKFSTALEWIAHHVLHATAVIHVLDDFLFVAPSHAQCQYDLNKFLRLCSTLGVPIAHEKTMGPFTCLQFVGITLDTITMEARLPQDKIDKCKHLLGGFLSRRSATLRDFQSLIGFLNFACSVIVPGRAFLRRLIDLTKSITKPHHHIKLTKAVKADLQTWLTFLDKYNGKSFFLPDIWESSHSLKLYTDAAGSKGYGGIFGTHWFYGQWDENWKSLNITVLELFPIVIALSLWGSQMSNKCITIFTDNGALVEVINRQTSKEPKVMTLIRSFVLTCLTHNILFRARHIPGFLNVQADYLSRFQVEEFLALRPDADIAPTLIPESLLPQNWSLI